MNITHFLNGRYVLDGELLISPKDLGFLRGYAVSDFIVTHHHKIPKLSDHIDRLFASANGIGIHIPFTREQVTSWLLDLVERNKDMQDMKIKTIVSGGVSSQMYQTADPTIVMIVDEYQPKPNSYYEKGIQACTVHYQREFSFAKHTNYIEAISQLTRMKDGEVHDLIYYNDLYVTEGSGNNVFAVIDKTLVTTQSDIVEGITRKILLEILRLPIPLEVRNFTLNELLDAEEIFLTGSGRGVIGVVAIDNKPVGEGNVGPITKEVSRQYRQYLKSL